MLYIQMQQYFENILSKYQCGFRKYYNSQHCPITMIQKWRESIDKGGTFGALLTDLSKAFNCLAHELLMAKLNTYGFDMRLLNLMYDYVPNRKQRVKVGGIKFMARIIAWGSTGINSRTIAIQYFYLWLILLSRRHWYSKLRDNTAPYNVSLTQELVINDLEETSSSHFKCFNNRVLTLRVTS